MNARNDDPEDTPAQRPSKKYSSQHALDYAGTAEDALERFLNKHDVQNAKRCFYLMRELRSWKANPPQPDVRRTAIIEMLELDKESRK